MAQPEAVIQTRGLRRVFKSRSRQVEAVAGVDLTVNRGEIFGFLGPNGAGKTTTLRMLATLLPPSGGTARVAGCELAAEPGRIRERDRKSTRLNSSHSSISYAVFCLK